MNKFLGSFAIFLVSAVLGIFWSGNAAGNEIRMKTTLTGPSATPWQATLENSADLQLQKFSEYQARCRKAFGGEMVFLDFPATVDGVRDRADEMSKKLKEFAVFDIRPTVIVEPVGEDGETLSFAEIADGGYDAVLEAYFSGLKNGGVTDRQMGLWVPLPEPNTDSWGEDNSDPADFVAAYNKFGSIFKKYFPTADIGPLLDNETYLWDAGDTAALPLDPYLDGIDKRLTDTFGLQGFPWPYIGAGGLETDYDAVSFLPAARAIDAAKILGIKSVWFNTGTFSSFYIDGQLVFPLAAGQRAQILETILGQLVLARDAGLFTDVNIFAQDKSGFDEGIDWSYWKDLSGSSGPDGAALCDFTTRARREGIGLSVFDTK